MFNEPKQDDGTNELKNELEKMDALENSTQKPATSGKVAPAEIVIPDKLAASILRTENALILSILTKDCSASIKQAAKDAIEPNQDDIKMTSDFLNAIIQRYAPTAFADPFMTMGFMYASSVAIKVAQVKAITGGGGK